MADTHIDSEIYKPIAGFEGLYQVTSLGRIYSTRRHMFLAAYTRGGYLQVGPYKNGQRRHMLIHVLVAEAFLPKPVVAESEELFVDHIDGVKTNNAVWNLRWATSRQNRLNTPLQANNTTGFIGVYKAGSKYRPYVCINGRQKYLGYYQCPEVAARIRDIYAWYNATERDREFLQLNFRDHAFLNDDTESICSDGTENSGDPVAEGAYGEIIEHYDAMPDTAPPFESSGLPSSIRDIELT